MKYILLLAIPFLLLGCTKNNQGSNPDYAYLNVNETYVLYSSTQHIQAYDINNDGQPDWGFIYGTNNYPAELVSYGANYTSYISDEPFHGCYKTLPSGYSISSTSLFKQTAIVNSFYTIGQCNTNLQGTGDFYIGFKSQNAQYTNSYYGWAKLNISSDGKTLIVKDMAINTVNGGSIATGQH